MDLNSMLKASRPFVSGIVGRAGSLVKGASRMPFADPIQSSPKMRLDMNDLLMKPENGGQGALPNVDYSKIGGMAPMDMLKAAMAGQQPVTPSASPFDEAGFMNPETPQALAPAVGSPMAPGIPMPQPRPPQAPQMPQLGAMDFQDQMMEGPSPLGKFGMFDAPGKQSNTLASFLKMFG